MLKFERAALALEELDAELRQGGERATGELFGRVAEQARTEMHIRGKVHAEREADSLEDLRALFHAGLAHLSNGERQEHGIVLDAIAKKRGWET